MGESIYPEGSFFDGLFREFPDAVITVQAGQIRVRSSRLEPIIQFSDDPAQLKPEYTNVHAWISSIPDLM